MSSLNRHPDTTITLKGSAKSAKQEIRRNSGFKIDLRSVFFVKFDLKGQKTFLRSVTLLENRPIEKSKQTWIID